MNKKLEITLFAVLGVAAVGIYGKLALREPGPAPAPESDDEVTGLRPPAPAPLLTGRVVSGLADIGHWRGKPALADLDADGDLDVVASIRKIVERTEDARIERVGEGLFVWLNDGQGGFTESVEGIPRTMGYGGASVADADGDGHLDIAFSGHDVTPRFFLGDGEGGWTEASDGIVTAGVCSDVSLGDVDGDGRFELATMGFFSRTGGLYTFELEEGGYWNFTADLLGDANFGAEVEHVDLDGDGRDEILAATEIGPKVWRYEDGEYVDLSAGLPEPQVGGSDLAVDAHDVDGDGFAELLVAGMIYEGHDPLRLYGWNGESWQELDAGLPADEAVFDVAFAQMDGEGPLEVVAAGKHGIFISTEVEPGRYERSGRVEETEGIVDLAHGDVTGDGKDDLLYVGFTGVRILDVSQAQAGTL